MKIVMMRQLEEILIYFFVLPDVISKQYFFIEGIQLLVK